jgi:hypothetical protein
MINVAVIVEPRLHEYLKPVIDNIIKNINIDTPIYIFHSAINEEFIKFNYNNYIDNKIKLIKLKQNNLTILQYNLLLTSVDFWNKINGENILIFQTDSCLCRHINTFDFSKYKDYGFIGAPSVEYSIKYSIPWQNGGFSIRKKSLMIKAILDNNTKQLITCNEDKYFSVIKKHITNPAPYDLAKYFSVEKYFYNNPLGIHKTWNYISEENWDKLKNKFPEIIFK